METFYTIINQVILMFLLIIVGFAAFKVKLINKDGISQIMTILLSFVMPSIVIYSYLRPFEVGLAINLGKMMVLSICMHAFMIIFTALIYRDKTDIKQVSLRASVIYTNGGFFAIPIVIGIFGDLGAFLGFANVSIFNFLVWTHLIYIVTGDKAAMSFKRSFFNPATISLLIGLALFFLPITLPDLVIRPIGLIAGMVTPLSMLATGALMAQVDIVGALKNASVHMAVLLRLVVVPILFLGALWLIMQVMPLDSKVVQIIMIQAAAPSAVVPGLMMMRHGKDPTYSSILLALTSILSVITLPLILILTQFIL